jgi:hypothetical protein
MISAQSPISRARDALEAIANQLERIGDTRENNDEQFITEARDAAAGLDAMVREYSEAEVDAIVAGYLPEHVMAG